jgi:ribonuclease HI
LEVPECVFEGYWRMSFDGACSKSRNEVGIVLVSLNKMTHHHTVRLEFPCMNNEEKYESLIQGMILTQGMKIEHLIVTRDLYLVINQITQKYKIKKEIHKLYFKRVNQLSALSIFLSFQGTRTIRPIH